MSIITKRGDGGMTDRLYGRQARKSSNLIEAIGTLDELNAWVGLAAKDAYNGYNGWTGDMHELIQKDLVSIMGELSAGIDNIDKYTKQFGAIGQEQISAIEEIVKKLEKGQTFSDWANPTSHWDVACRVCRRAERALYRYSDGDDPTFLQENVRKEVLVYINRLSDLLWIWGRK